MYQLHEVMDKFEAQTFAPPYGRDCSVYLEKLIDLHIIQEFSVISVSNLKLLPASLRCQNSQPLQFSLRQWLCA